MFNKCVSNIATKEWIKKYLMKIFVIELFYCILRFIVELLSSRRNFQYFGNILERGKEDISEVKVIFLRE